MGKKLIQNQKSEEKKLKLRINSFENMKKEVNKEFEILLEDKVPEAAAVTNVNGTGAAVNLG